MEVAVLSDAIIGFLKIPNLEAHIPNVLSTTLLAYGFIKYSLKGNAPSPTRTNGNSLVSAYKHLGGGMLSNPPFSACPILLAVNTPPSLWRPASPMSTRVNW